MRLRTLGGLRLEGADFGRPKPLLLLCYLAVEGPKDRRFLSELFWPRASSPHTNLRTALSQLRHGAPGAIEEADGRMRAAIESDADALLSALESGQLGEAAELYTGSFLEGLHLPDLGAELEEWVYSTREHLAESVQEALLTRGEEAAAGGDFAAAAELARDAYRLPGSPEPGPETLERIHRLLAAGNSPLVARVRSQAADYGIELNATAADSRQVLQGNEESKDVGLIPHSLPSRVTSFVGRDAELFELSRLLAQPDTRLITVSGPGGTGKTRFALQAAQQELAAGNFAGGVHFVPLDSLNDGRLIPGAISGVLGLEEHAADEHLPALVESIGHRQMLLVLDNCEQLAQGIGVVSELLAGCAGLKVIATSRERLNLEEEQLFPIDGLSYPANAELSLEEAQAHDALRLFLQRAQRVQPTFVLSEENLPDVIRICNLVWGSPLGIELAASWVRMMPTGEIANELARSLDLLVTSSSNLPKRHRSMRATIEHSWRLLDGREQEALMKLAVFVGGFSREAAARVANASIPLLASLVDKSLLRVLPNGRYDRHPLLYQFTVERLAQHPEHLQSSRDEHTAYFIEFSKRAVDELQGAGQIAWLDRLEADHDNLRAILERSLGDGERLAALQLTSSLWRFWHTRGYWSEGRRWLERAIGEHSSGERSGDTREQPLLAALAESLRGHGMLASAQGELDVATRSFSESLELSSELGDRERTAALYNDLGVTALHQGDHGRAATMLERSLELRRELGDDWGVASTLNNLGAMAGKRGDSKRARGYYEESLALFRSLESGSAVAILVSNLGDVAEYQGDLERAEALFSESLALNRQLGAKAGIAASLTRLGAVARRRGKLGRARSCCLDSLLLLRDLRDGERVAECLNELAMIEAAAGRPELAATLWGATESLLEATGTPLPDSQLAEYERAVRQVRDGLDEAAFETAWIRGQILSLDRAIEFALERDSDRQRGGVARRT